MPSRLRSAIWAGAAAILIVAALACQSPRATPAPSGSSGPSGATDAKPIVAAQTATPRPDVDAGVTLEEFPRGDPRNEVRLANTEKMRFKARASIRLQRIAGDEVTPTNIASAQGSCMSCQAIAVAVQVVFYRRGASNVSPINVALASNAGCTRCVTAARAIQYVIPVDDPTADVPAEVDRLVQDLDRELRFLASVKTWDQITSDEALARIQRVLDQHEDLKGYLGDVSQTQRADNAAAVP